MRPRIKKAPVLVASSSEDKTIQSLCAFNRKQYKQLPKKSYVLMCFGIKKILTESEYKEYLSKGLGDLITVEVS